MCWMAWVSAGVFHPRFYNAGAVKWLYKTGIECGEGSSWVNRMVANWKIPGVHETYQDGGGSRY